MPRSTSELYERLKGQSRAVAYELVEPLTSFLTVARAVTGDLDRVLIMVTITLRSSRHPDFRSGAAFETGEDAALPGFGTNVRSVADSTGIPKETVRRKVRELVAMGWVVRDGNTLHYSALGYEAATPVREAMLRMYARGYEVIRQVEAETAR